MPMHLMGPLDNNGNVEPTAQLAREAYEVAAQQGLVDDTQQALVVMTRTVVTGATREECEERVKALSQDLKQHLHRKDLDGTKIHSHAVYSDTAEVLISGGVALDGAHSAQDMLNGVRKLLMQQDGLSEEEIDAAVEFARQHIPGLSEVTQPVAETPEYTDMTIDQLLDVGLWEMRRTSWGRATPDSPSQEG